MAFQNVEPCSRIVETVPDKLAMASLLCVPLSCLLLWYPSLQSSLQPSHQALRADVAEWISLSSSDLTPLRVSLWVGLCCIVIKTPKVLQSSPVAQLVLVLKTT